jgi:aryl-alcohol dehydrogenase-like predicted oxidoreductase
VARISPESLTARDHTVARAVQEVADDHGVTCSQVAIACAVRCRPKHLIALDDMRGALEQWRDWTRRWAAT